MLKTFSALVKNHLINIPGWRTDRKILIIESDDWGAIRMPSKRTYDALLSKAIPVDRNYFNRYDSLECNADLEALFDVLRKHRDKNGRHPVFTTLSIMANPDFNKIRENNFERYFYESVADTLKNYGYSHSNVLNLWQEGIKEKLFHPQFHGREHLNVQRWMRAIKMPGSVLRTCFDFNFYGLSSKEARQGGGDYLPAFDLDDISELTQHQEILQDGVQLFKNTVGYHASFFVAPNSLFNTQLEAFLALHKIHFLAGARQQKEPLGRGKIKKNFRYTGKYNEYQQVYLSRNVQFEQNASSYEFSYQHAIRSISNAFLWKKPAIISTHRANYAGYINEDNRKKGLRELDLLLAHVIKLWPDVEFMTSIELGNQILSEKGGR